MNYHNKIKSLGFKRYKSTLVCDHDRYVDKKEGYKLQNISEFHKNYKGYSVGKDSNIMSDIWASH